MEVISNKRPQEMDLNDPVEPFAVCTSCSRVSKNLKTCDNCNCPLTEDNSAQCYSAEPKRLRVESVHEVMTANQTEPPAEAASTAALVNTVRPETLFVNVNNQAVPVLVGHSSGSRPALVFSGGQSVSSQSNLSTAYASSALSVARPRLSSAMTRPPAAVPSSVEASAAAPCNGSTFSARPVVSSLSANARAAVDSSLLGQPRPALTSVTNHSEPPFTSNNRPPTASPQITLPTYNLQPPPPPFASGIARLPMAGGASPSVPNVVPISGSSPMQNTTVTAIQIRIGSKKFKPVSPVTFKDDGILFTLKDYTYAPVLLNARAIVKCKANLNTFSYPVLFLFLEASCMRQIRQIFGLANNEFAAGSDVELKRCISIFPIFGVEGKQQVQQLTFSIKRSFEAMVKRYPRSSAILEEITNDTVLNILLESACLPESSGLTDPNASAVSTVASSVTSIQVSGTSTATGTRQLMPQLQALAPAPAILTNGVAASVSDRFLNDGTASGIVNRVIAQGAPVSASTSSTTTAPPLVIPSDANRWQAMQKNLVVGGVYHVQTPDKQKRYCLWNGTQLVPCLVQNTEVTLSCSRIRIGSMSTQCIGQVRIKADGASGIYFTMKDDKTGLQEVYLGLADMSSLLLCVTQISVIFITLTPAGGDKLNAKIRLSNKDPMFDLNSSEMMKKYILLFLPEVNHDQEEALKQMRFSCNGPAPVSITLIEASKALNILAAIRWNVPAVKASEYLYKNKLNGNHGFYRLALELIEVKGLETSNNDDDDDDVIMTQEELGIKCPYTQKVMTEPVQNVHCGHNYEKGAIQEFILRRKGNAKCPYAGCGNVGPLRMEDLVDNLTLKDYISKMASQPKNQPT